MGQALKWIQLTINIGLVFVFTFSALNHQLIIYLVQQAQGQLHVLKNRQTFSAFAAGTQLSTNEKQNLLLIEKIKNYSIDSLAYKPTRNFTSIYNQNHVPVLWVITACEPYALKPYEWQFPIVGKVSYKGFFKKQLALDEMSRLNYLGYDTDLRSVTAWSTLGWFDDPLLSNMLQRSKGGFCNLLFHELFHATYYAKNSVDRNENLANFIAHKATLRFLSSDSTALKNYEETIREHEVFNKFMLRKYNELKHFYPTIINSTQREVLKNQKLRQISDSVDYLTLKNKSGYLNKKEMILRSANAFFIDFQQYESMQDSMEYVFNKIYRGDIKKLVQDLTSNKINY